MPLSSSLDIYAALVGAAFWVYLFTMGSGILAMRKRRSVWGWALGGFLVGPFAFATIALLPPLRDEEDEEEEARARGDTRPCPFCLSRIPLAATACRYCQRDVVPLTRRPSA